MDILISAAAIVGLSNWFNNAAGDLALVGRQTALA